MMKRISGYGPSLVVLTTTILVLLAGPAAVRKLTHAHTRTKVIQASRRLADSTILAEIDQAYRDIATVVEPSVVHISTEEIVSDGIGRRARKASSGSGWIYDELGHIVTNQHVIEEADRIEVQLYNGVIRQATIVGTDPTTDIAVLRIVSADLIPATRRDVGAQTVRQGDLVFAFGSPFDFRFSMSSGVVSGKGRSVGVIRNERGQTGYENFIQVDAAINPGNSGGPLTDYRGHVIGMNTAIATGRRTPGNFDDGQFAGIGLAIPIEMIEPVVDQLIDSGVVSKGYLGLSPVDRQSLIAEEIKGILKFRGFGLLVAAIEPDHPTLIAGLEPGDVITRVHDQPVYTIQQFLAVAASLEPGRDVAMEVWRFDDERDLGEYMQFLVPSVFAKGLRGISLLHLDDTMAAWLDLQGFAGRGVRVARLAGDGPARDAGLRRGDVITHVNREPIESLQALRSVISSMLPGQIARLSVWRASGPDETSQRIEIAVALDQLNSTQASGTIPSDQSRERIAELGIERMATSSRHFAGQFDAEYHPGVIVLSVTPGSVLDDVVPNGSTIVEVMEEPVEDVEEFLDALGRFDLRSDRGVRVTMILPDGSVQKPVLRAE